MMMFRRIIVTICVVFIVQQNFSQVILNKDTIVKLSSDEINQLNFESYTVEDFSRAYDVVLELINDNDNIDNRIKGTNVLGALAKELYVKVKNKGFDLDASETEILLKKFESQSYYIDRPTPSQFLKLMKYSCQGDYSHIYERFRTSSFFKPTMAILTTYFLFLLYCIFNRKRKKQAVFIKLSALAFALCLIVFIVFKLSCESNVQDYSFYGITM